MRMGYFNWETNIPSASTLGEVHAPLWLPRFDMLRKSTIERDLGHNYCSILGQIPNCPTTTGCLFVAHTRHDRPPRMARCGGISSAPHCLGRNSVSNAGSALWGSFGQNRSNTIVARGLAQNKATHPCSFCFLPKYTNTRRGQRANLPQGKGQSTLYKRQLHYMVQLILTVLILCGVLDIPMYLHVGTGIRSRAL